MSVFHKDRPQIVSLQEAGFPCENYYWNEGGRRRGISRENLREVGVEDDTMWIHESMIPGLQRAREDVRQHGFDLLIKDAFRPVALYELIKQRSKDQGLLTCRFNFDRRVHATYMAIDVVLLDEDNECPWMRDDGRDGQGCYKIDFYRHRSELENAQEFQRLQDILTHAMLSVGGFWVGSRREYWHYELYSADHAIRF